MDKIEKIKTYYFIICENKLGDGPDALQERVNIIRFHEKELKTEFKDTQDLHRNVEALLLKKEKIGGTKLREIRNEKEWSQEALAASLGCSCRHINRMEQNKVPLSKNALRFVQEFDELEKDKRRKESRFFKRKVQKLENESNYIHKAKNVTF